MTQRRCDSVRGAISYGRPYRATLPTENVVFAGYSRLARISYGFVPSANPNTAQVLPTVPTVTWIWLRNFPNRKATSI
jgi:hypothetical protein